MQRGDLRQVGSPRITGCVRLVQLFTARGPPLCRLIAQPRHDQDLLDNGRLGPSLISDLPDIRVDVENEGSGKVHGDRLTWGTQADGWVET